MQLKSVKNLQACKKKWEKGLHAINDLHTPKKNRRLKMNSTSKAAHFQWRVKEMGV